MPFGKAFDICRAMTCIVIFGGSTCMHCFSAMKWPNTGWNVGIGYYRSVDDLKKSKGAWTYGISSLEFPYLSPIRNHLCEEDGYESR